MAQRRTGRLWASLVVLALSAGVIVAARAGYLERVRQRIQPPPPPRLSAGDFPAGVSAPLDDLASLPDRPTVIGVVPRGSVAGVVWAGAGEPGKRFYRTGFAIDVDVKLYEQEEALRQALMTGAENGGVDLAGLAVPVLAMASSPLRDAAPRTVMLLGRSRGQEVLGAKSELRTPASLRGKRLGVEPKSTSWYFALWVLSRAGLSTKDVTLVPLPSVFDAGQALKDGRADAVAGFLGDVGEAVKETSGTTMSSTADAPHLIATVLVARGDFAARYPDAIKRVVRGTLEANRLVRKDSQPAARVLGELAPRLGDPTEAILSAPPANLQENRGFFGLSGPSPVTYVELYKSAAALSAKLGGPTQNVQAEDTADLMPLKYVSRP